MSDVGDTGATLRWESVEVDGRRARYGVAEPKRMELFRRINAGTHRLAAGAQVKSGEFIRAVTEHRHTQRFQDF